MIRSLAPTLAVLALSSAVLADERVIPRDFLATPGGATFLGPLSGSPRTYQLLIHADQLSGLAGSDIAGIAWRLLPSATSAWPAAAVSFGSYDIYLSGSVDPSARSLTFANNIVGPQTQVRSGPLQIDPGSYPAGGSPNSFGPAISFSQPYTYTGGNLLIEIRHTGFTGTNASIDAVAATNTTAGYGTQFSACWQSSYTATSALNGNFGVIQLRIAAGPAPCYANCDGSTAEPILNVNDFICFQTKYAQADPGANCDGSTAEPILNVNDFICFQTQFAAGCP